MLPSLDLSLPVMATEVRRRMLGEAGSDEMAAMKSAIDALSLPDMSRLRSLLSVKGALMPAKVGGRGSVLPPIANTYCIGLCDDDEHLAIYVSELAPIYGLTELRNEEDQHDVVTHIRVHVDTDEAVQMGVRILEVLELETGENKKTEGICWTVLVFFEAPAKDWSQIHSWRRAFGITLVCGYELRTPYYTMLALNDVLSEDVTLTFKAKYARSRRGYVVLRAARIDNWRDKRIVQELSPTSGLSYRSRLTTCPQRCTETLGIIQSHTFRHDDSYRLDFVVNSIIEEEAGLGTVYLFDGDSGANVRAIHEIVSSDAFAVQLAEDAGRQDPPPSPRPASVYLPAIGTATATGIFAAWVDELLSRCDRDLDCVCKMHDLLLVPRMTSW